MNKCIWLMTTLIVLCMAMATAAETGSHDKAALVKAPTSSGDGALDAYVRTALENNAGLRAAFDRWQAEMETIPQAQAIPDPTFQWTHFIEEVQTRTGPQNNRFVLSQKIPWTAQREQAGKIAESKAMQYWWVAVARKDAIIQEVKHVYAEYAFLAQHIRIVNENLTLLRNLEPIVQVRLRNGGNQGDLLRLQVEIAKLENELHSLEGLRPALNRQLRAVMNQSGGEILPWPTTQESGAEIFQPGDLLQKVHGNNPALKQLDALATHSEHQATYRVLQKKPDVTVGLTYIDTGDAKMDPRPSGSGDDPFGITVGVSIPIWSKKYDARIQQARYTESSMRHRIKQKRLDLGAQLEMEAYRLQDAARSITLYRDTLIPRARQAMDVIQVSYQSGNTSLLDIIESERDVLVFQQSYWRSQRDYAQSRAKIEALCGGDLS